MEMMTEQKWDTHYTKPLIPYLTNKSNTVTQTTDIQFNLYNNGSGM